MEKNSFKKKYDSCLVCPRNCKVNRNQGEFGFCKVGPLPFVAHVMLHHWEEPCVSGTSGSGAIFFSGCSLKCVYCQNRKISSKIVGKKTSIEELVNIFFSLKEQGAHNINLVSMSHFTPAIREAIIIAKERGFDLPFISNTSGYENVSTLKSLSGLIDIYLTDFKYMRTDLSKKYSFAENYPQVVKAAICEMHHQQPICQFDENGLMKKGIIVRHLCIPGHTNDSKDIIKYIHENYKESVILSIMNQFTPLNDVLTQYPEINRTLTDREYNSIIDYALSIGVGEKDEAFIQGKETCKESFIPEFIK